jgi:AcrR family transcriptional regulator
VGVSSHVDKRAVRGQETRLKILDAARQMLVEHGAGGTSTRSVAEEAGVPLSLVHYHFGGKQGLLVAVLERENTELLERQRALYAQPGPLADKWRTACDLLDEDINSGFVRVLWELWAAGLADEELKAGWRSALGGWRDLLVSVFEEWGRPLSDDLPLSPRATATLVADLFNGIEVELLAGVSPEDAPHREVLDAFGDMIERAEKADR